MARYLVTGGAGFIESHVVDRLVAGGHQVRVIDDLSSGRLENLARVADRIEFIKEDIRNRNAVIKASQTSGVSGEVFNVALGEEHTVLDLLKELNAILGLSIPATFKPPRPGDVLRTYADSSKAARLLKWTGRVTFAEGLRRTVEWFKAHPPL